MAVILDASSTTFRNAMYDQYKANRPPPPERKDINESASLRLFLLQNC